MNGLDAARVVLGGDLTPERIQRALDDPIDAASRIRLQLIELTNSHTTPSNYFDGEPVPDDGVLTVAIARRRLPAWTDEFVDGVMLPLLYAPRVAVEDPVSYAVGLHLGRNSPQVVGSYLGSALHVTQQLAPLIDDGHVLLLGVATGLGGLGGLEGSAFRPLIWATDAPLAGQSSNEAFWDLALFFGCRFLASPWLPTRAHGIRLVQLVEALAMVGVDVPDGFGRRPTFQSAISTLVPNLGRISPLDIARLRSTSKIYSEWLSALADLLKTSQALERVETSNDDIQKALLERLDAASAPLRGLTRSDTFRKIFRGAVRDTAMASLGLMFTTPFQAASSVGIDIVGVAGTAGVSALTRTIGQLRPAETSRRLAQEALFAHFNVFMVGE